MTPLSRVRSPVVALAAVLGLACAPRSPTASAAAPAANHGPRPSQKLEQSQPSVAAIESEPSPPELRCDELDSLPDDLDGSSRQELLSVLARTTATPQELGCLQRTVERFFPRMARERPPPDDLAALPDWWRTLGYAGYYTHADPKGLVILPEPVPGLSPASRTRLAPLLCSKDDGSCGSEARVFLADAEARMTELANLTRLEELVEDAREDPLPSPEDEIAACTDEARKEPREWALSEWRSCVTASVPRLVRTPSGSFKMPAQGILTTHRSGYWDPCAEAAGFSLVSGLTLTKVDCWLPDVKRKVQRWTITRVSPSGVRRIALFIALMETMRTGPAFANVIPIPEDLPSEDPHHFSSAPSMGVSISDAPEFRYSVDGVLAEPLSGRVYVYDEIEPRKRFLAGLLRTSQVIGSAACAVEEDQSVLAELLAQMFPDESDLRALEEQVTRTVSCR